MFLKSYAHMVVGALFFLWHVLRTVVFALATFFIWVIGFKPVETMLIQATVFFGIIGVGVLFTVFPMWLLTLFASSAFIFPLEKVMLVLGPATLVLFILQFATIS